jgi:tetratricopeptide (TPR) repeat protein
VGLYDVFYELKDFNQALGVINDLVSVDKKYREDQVSLYMYTKQYDKALSLIKVLDEDIGASVERDAFKRQIFMDAKYREAEKEFLLAQIKKYPKKESNYISIIYLYSESNQEEMAFEMAKLLEKNIPDSEWAQVGLFKFYLNNKKIDEAVQSMTTVLKNTSINSKIKYKIINEFLIFTNNNAGYDKYLEDAIEHIDEEGTVKIAKDIGKYYQKNNNEDKAIRYFRIALENAPNDLDAHLLLLQSYLKKGEFKMIAVESENLLEIYPLQPDLFYLAGMSNNKIGRFKKAKDFLESGLELIVDDVDLTINFYLQLVEACNGLGDTKCRDNYLYQSKKSLRQKK